MKKQKGISKFVRPSIEFPSRENKTLTSVITRHICYRVVFFINTCSRMIKPEGLSNLNIEQPVILL